MYHKCKWLAGIGILILTSSQLSGAQIRSTLSPSAIDSSIRAEWKNEGIIPSSQVDDAGFLRRAYLDIAGTIPPAQVVSEFLADKSTDKRSKAVEALLDSPRYSENWTNYWNHVLMDGRAENQRFTDRGAFRQWLKEQFDSNTPWNKLVFNLISSTGQNSTGDAQVARLGLTPASSVDPKTGAKINGATNWILKYQNKPEDLSGTASKIFLGVQIQCAQCHDHKTEKWKQEDFRKFTACFVNTRPKIISNDKMAKDYRVELIDVNRPFVPRGKNAQVQANAKNMAVYAGAKPSALDGTDFSDTPNRRQALAAWMTAPENPWFAEAIVNRIWSHFMGRGFIEPVDDFRPSNPAVMPELLKKLADDFVAHDYDLKHLIQTICSTQAYQLSVTPGGKTDQENHFWGRQRLKALGPDQTLDTVITATNLEPVLEKQFGANEEQMKQQIHRQFSFLFDVDEEFEQKEFEGGIAQALMLLNGGLTNKAVSPIPGTALAEVMAMNASDSQKIESLYLRTLSRKPSAVETQKWLAFLQAPRDVVLNGANPGPMTRMQQRQQMMKNQKPGAQGKRPNNGPDPFNRLNAGGRQSMSQTPMQQAYEDMFWALLNSSEFMFNH